jgi:hypothetical protein
LFFSWADCGVKFSAKSSLYVHLKKHNKPKSAAGDKVVYHCPIEKCTRMYTCKSSLRQHMLKFHTPVLGKKSFTVATDTTQTQEFVSWIMLLAHSRVKGENLFQ